MFLSAFAALRDPESRAYYDRKIGQGPIWTRTCSWATAGAWGGGAVVLLTGAWIADPDRVGGGLIAAISNGVLLFFLVGGISVLDRLRSLDADDAARPLLHRPWILAAIPAAATLIALLPLRIAALAAGVRGPWSGLAESTLDITVRAAIVWVALGITGMVIARRAR